MLAARLRLVSSWVCISASEPNTKSIYRHLYIGCLVRSVHMGAKKSSKSLLLKSCWENGLNMEHETCFQFHPPDSKGSGETCNRDQGYQDISRNMSRIYGKFYSAARCKKKLARRQPLLCPSHFSGAWACPSAAWRWDQLGPPTVAPLNCVTAARSYSAVPVCKWFWISVSDFSLWLLGFCWHLHFFNSFHKFFCWKELSAPLWCPDGFVTLLLTSRTNFG